MMIKIPIERREPVMRWIPCAERMPEDGVEVLICMRDRSKNLIKIGRLGMHDIEDNNFRLIGKRKVWYANDYYTDLDTIIAWMPLPEPYEGREK